MDKIMGLDISTNGDYSCINAMTFKDGKSILLEHKLFEPNDKLGIDEYKKELRNKYKGIIEIR